jgi:phytoene synthase
LDAREAAERVRAVARAGDPDRYAAALFLPAPARDRLFALIAYNVELASVASQVKEPQLGEIRLEWWREAIERGFAGEASGNPVADEVVRAARGCGLSPSDLTPLIDARLFDMAVKRMPVEAALNIYLGDTAGTMFGLAARMVDPADAGKAAEAAGLAGRAYGLTGLMRSLPYHLAAGRIDIPADALRRHGIAPHDLLAGHMSQGLGALLAEWRDLAREALDGAMQEIALLPRAVRPAFLPLALVEPYLRLLSKQRDPLHDVVMINPLYRLWRLGTSSLR